MATGFYNWSRTASVNGTATYNWAEGMAPSAVNDSARGIMSDAAQWRDDISGAITTGGTSTAYTVTSYSNYDTLAHLSGNLIAFTPHATNGATVTLNVDGLGAKPLRSSPGVELVAGTLIQGTPYEALYNSSDSAFYLRSFYGNPYNTPVGGLMFYLGTTAPNSAFVFPYGQAISRTTYATLFTLIGTTYGTGDGSTTFNLPNAREKAFFGWAGMGGGSATAITTAGSGIDGGTVGSSGGGQNVTMARSDMPNTTVSVAVSDTRVFDIAADTSGRTLQAQNMEGGGGGTTNFTLNYTSGGANPLRASVSSGSISGSFGLNGGVTQTLMNKMPPAMILPVLARVI